MFQYRNIVTGRILERPQEDEWLEASSGWTRIDEPAPEPATDNDRPNWADEEE